jgi:uncharacterized protein
MKNVLFLSLLLSLAFTGCTQNDVVSSAPHPTPPKVDSNTNSDGTEVRDPPPLLEFPRPEGFVSDFAEALSEKEQQDLEAVLVQFRDSAKIDLAIALIISTDERTTYEYSLAMAKEWKIGSENGGALLLVAVEDRKWWIQIDKKLQAYLTNDDVKKIGDVMVPDLKEKKYAAGLRKCIDKMIAELKNKRG